MGGTDARNPETGMEISGRFGTYKLIEKIGGGGNGTVYSVEVIYDGKQLPEGECFVIKILNVSFCGDKEREKREKRFEKEIKYVYQIQSEIEGVIPIYDSSYFLKERGGFTWYLMPKALRYNFRNIHSTEEKLKDMRNIGDCLLNLHNRGLVHRDIKHQNLLVYKNRVCLTDFGLVRNMEEMEEHITDMHDDMGPAAIRPPEMRSIENPDGIDYRKSDVYLFAKTVWIVLTGVKGGFPEQYRRSEKGIYLDKKKLQVETAEPLHAMLESATRYFWWERIDISTCVRHIDDQLEVIWKRAGDSKLGKWKYTETLKEVCENIVADIKTYQDLHSIQEVLDRMAGTINLVFEEAGKSYEPMFLKGVQILSESQFELDVRNIYRSRKKIIVEIEKISVGIDLSCIMETKIIANQSNDVPIFTNLNKALQSIDKQIGISGVYSIRFEQTKDSFC